MAKYSNGNQTTVSPSTPVELTDPKLYLNRELTWLAFNRRVLQEAANSNTLLLERVKFIAIVSSNLDEFFMKRIGGLKQQIGAGYNKLSVDGRTPEQQILECAANIGKLLEDIDQHYLEIVTELAQRQIYIIGYNELTPSEKHRICRDYQQDVLPLITPLGLDSSHPFPLISNLSLNLLVTLSELSGKQFYARVKVPVGPNSPRFIRVGKGHRYLPLEEVVAHNLHLIFPDCGIESYVLFRVTRNATGERNEEQAEDLLAMIEEELRNRKFAPTVRLEITRHMASRQQQMLIEKLGIDPTTDVYRTTTLIGKADLMELLAIDVPTLFDPPHRPIDNPQLAIGATIFSTIRQHHSILLQHPKESFSTSVERFLAEASLDPNVLAIKATLYRTSENSEIVSNLSRAAANGKHVAVMVELKARFDEAANVRWARHLEEAGVHVSFGVIGLKTHCKAILVIRRENGKLKRYVHVGTGNYHAGTAKVYVDFGLLSCDEDLGHDIADLFNCLTSGRNVERVYRKILTAPKMMKRVLLQKIDREIAHHSSDGSGHIRLKTNALEDSDVVHALYRAGSAGVRVELLVRDTCRLRPGLTGLSESITVTSTVSRFLEHSRIYYFRNGGEEEYFIGSADLMQRNLEHRIELLVPVEIPALMSQLRSFLDAQLADHAHLWTMQSDGTYTRIPSHPTPDQHPTTEPRAAIADVEFPVSSLSDNPGDVILLIEPDIDLRNSLSELLTIMGYQILLASNPEQALKLHVSTGTHIDHYLVAAFMPNMTGLQFINTARKQGSGCAALLYSSWALETDLWQQLRNESIGFLALPFSRDSLHRSLTKSKLNSTALT